MGNSYNITKHYPYDIENTSNLTKSVLAFKDQSFRTTVKKCQNKQYELVLIMVHSELENYNYAELSTRFISDGYIIIVIKKLNFIDDHVTMFKQFIIEQLKIILYEFIIKYGLLLTVSKIHLVCHGDSCNNLIDLSLSSLNIDIIDNYIIIDPMFNQKNSMIINNIVKYGKFDHSNDNISIVLPSDNNIDTSQSINNPTIVNFVKLLCKNVFLLNNVDRTHLYNHFIGNLKEIQKCSVKWDQLYTTIKNIISQS